MEKAVVEAEEAEAKLGDDLFMDEDEENADVLRVLSCKPQAAVVVKPASRQTLENWVASAWKKLDKCPSLLSKSFEVTSITVNNDNESVRNKKVQEEIATGFDANATGSDSEEEGEADEDSKGENCDGCSDFPK